MDGRTADRQNYDPQDRASTDASRGKTGHFAQLKVQLGSGKAAKNWSCTPLRSHKMLQ